MYAPAEISGASASASASSEQPLGLIPHQIRGSLSQFSQMTLVGHASNTCTACSKIVSLTIIQFGLTKMTFLENLIWSRIYLLSSFCFSTCNFSDCIRIPEEWNGFHFEGN